MVWLNKPSFSKKPPTFLKATVVIRFPSKKKRRLPKSTARFPAKKWYSPPSVGLSWDSPPPVCTGVRTLTSQPKFSHFVRLPNLLSNGALLARYVRGLPYKNSLRQLTLNEPVFFSKKDVLFRMPQACLTKVEPTTFRRPLDCIKFALRASFILNLTFLHNNNSSFVYCLQITVSYKESPLYMFYFNRWIAA